ncbi:hypothetical protein ACFS7Z_15840 [Pontibacter toksunensis]|uniref:Uncharacterized protein n=1 Tax=Pontibacter toksunensis TaxID=1332631 RepID=A0ABW6BWB9_9BACT
MEEPKTLKSLGKILRDPSELESLMKNPGKYGLDFYKSLTAKDKQYVAFAAAAGLIIYGLSLSRHK